MKARPAAILKAAILALALAGYSSGRASDSAAALTPALRSQALDYIAVSLRKTLTTVGDSFPVATEKGVWQKDNGGWTGGYFAGMLWMMFEASGDSAWLAAARRYTGLLEPNKTDVENIDIGILFWPSFDLGWRLTGDSLYRETGLAGARTMLKRFIPAGGYFQNWGELGQKDQLGFVIIDCLINLDHLFWATEQTGDSAFAAAAVSHAARTAGCHVRPDGSSYQVVEFDPADGRCLRGFKKQGYADESTWSRGQSWGVYGFARVYRHTHEKKFLAVAERLADWFIAHLPPDYVPYWDFSAPRIPDDARDTSAASMAASGLLDLAALEPDSARAGRYRKAAKKILASLTASYLTHGLPGRNDGVLTGGTYFYALGHSIDQANIWGDFYYLEALLRLDGVR